MNIYDFSVENIKGDLVSLKEYEGKVLLVVNSATRCGFTPQYDDLEDLYEKYSDQGFTVLEFPSNEFGEQTPENNSEIVTFCNAKFGIRFPQFAKTLVNGEYANPVYKFMKSKQSFKGFDPEHPLTSILESMMDREHPDYKETSDIKWNFTKFLIDRNGEVVNRFEPTTNFEEIKSEIEKYL